MSMEEPSLTDEQFCALLMEPHAATDSAEVVRMKDALEQFRAETLLWAERRSAAGPSLAAAARRQRLWALAPQWSLAAVAFVTIAAALLHITGSVHGSKTSGDISTTEITQPANPQQLANDNELLQSIDAALNSESGLPVDALGLERRGVPHPSGSVE